MNAFDHTRYAIPARRFKALGHPVRLWIACQLADGEHCVQELVAQTPFDFSTISQHLNTMKDAGILEDEKRGKQVFYRLSCDCVRQFLACMEDRGKTKTCK